MIYYICKYSDYVNLPSQLFMSNTKGRERKSLNGNKFIVWCGIDTPTNGMLYWMNGTETGFTHHEITNEIIKPEWTEDN